MKFECKKKAQNHNTTLKYTFFLETFFSGQKDKIFSLLYNWNSTFYVQFNLFSTKSGIA